MSRMATRQLAIMRILESGRIVTVREICEEVESGRSTVLRDLLDLSANYPIETKSGRHGGVLMLPSAKVGRQYFTKEELAYIIEAVAVFEGGAEIKTTILQKIMPTGRSE